MSWLSSTTKAIISKWGTSKDDGNSRKRLSRAHSFSSSDDASSKRRSSVYSLKRRSRAYSLSASSGTVSDPDLIELPDQDDDASPSKAASLPTSRNASRSRLFQVTSRYLATSLPGGGAARANRPADPNATDELEQEGHEPPIRLESEDEDLPAQSPSKASKAATSSSRRRLVSSKSSPDLFMHDHDTTSHVIEMKERRGASSSRLVIVSSLERGSLCYLAGLKKGDIITHVNFLPVKTAADVAMLVGDRDFHWLTVRRDQPDGKGPPLVFNASTKPCPGSPPLPPDAPFPRIELRSGEEMLQNYDTCMAAQRSKSAKALLQ
eukprot:g80141.t1